MHLSSCHFIEVLRACWLLQVNCGLLKAQHNMTAESIELERIPLQELQRLEEGSRGSSAVFLGEAAPTVSTSGRSVPTINWGEKRMSPGDLKVIQAISSSFPLLVWL